MTEEPQIVEMLSDGAETVVYRARIAGEGVVLKLLKSTHDDALHRARLERELAMAKRVESAHVVEARGLASHAGRLGLVLEDFGGAALRPNVTREMSLGEKLGVAADVARALAAIHGVGLVHCDVKPSNVIHRVEGRVTKLTDFGIAVAEGDARTHPSALLEGTLAYMAPEQTRRMDRDLDHRADLYSLGVLLFELFVGQRPFRANDPVEWMHCHAAVVPPRMIDVAPGIPVVLSDLVARLLAKAPEDRYQLASAVARDLERCRDTVGGNGAIEPFALASFDATGELRLPRAVYGRARELASIASAFRAVVERASTGVLLVRGPAGVGKTALVRELQPEVVRAAGWFAYGKFDQYRRHVPYSAFVDAVHSLVAQLLASSGERVTAFEAQLTRAVAGNGRALVELFPDLGRILGDQPALAELPPAATQNRLQFAVRALLRAFDGPLVLFIDDLQWADDASLALLDDVLSLRGDTPLFVVLSYREGEVSEKHPLHAIVARAETVTTLDVGLLDPASVLEIVRATLRTDGEPTESVARLLVEKTAGNPFFVRELLRSLHLEGMLRFDDGAFRLDPRAETVAATDNVLDLLVARLRQLPESTREALRISALLGNELDLAALAEVTGRDVDAVVESLRAAVESGLVTLDRPRLRFHHDRIQQAACALTDDAEKTAVHLRVARVLARQLDESSPAGVVFDVANHFVAAFDALEDPGEREDVLQLFLRAARCARRATAYPQSRVYFERAADLLGASAWSTRFELAFDVHVDLAECAYLAGDHSAASALFTALLERAHTDLERARIHYLQIRQLQVAGDFAAAASLCVRSFALFGLHAPESDEDAARAVEEQHRVVEDLLGARPIAEHIDDPVMTDPRMGMLADLLEASGPPLYMVRPALFPWVALHLVTLSLRYGNSEASCYGYGIYALLRAAVMNDVDGGHACSQLAIDLNAKMGVVKLEGCMLHLLGDHVNFWKHPIATDLPILERGFEACVRGGDHIYSNYIGFQAPWHAYESGAKLADVRAMISRYAAFAIDTNYAPVHWTLRAEEQLLRALEGRTEAPGRLDDEGFREEEACARLREAQFGCGIVYLHVLQLVARTTFGDFAGALAAAELAEPELGAAFSMPMYVTFVVHHALALANERTSERDLEIIRGHHRSLETWARACPANFADKAALIGAELARIAGDVGGALSGYERARLAARAQGMPQYEALACERAAALYATLGIESVRRSLLVDAVSLYDGWGASGKVAALLRANPWLDGEIARGDAPLAHTSGTQSTTGREYDLLSLLKATQSLSAEIQLPRLLSRLISIVVEYVGAHRGSLVLIEDDRLVVATEAATESGTLRVSSMPPRDASSLPTSLLQYVRRTGERVLLDDASTDNPFRDDPYFQHGTHRSVLCKPIARAGRSIGMFYLENDLVTGAFGPNRLATLRVLASQTAISIENSRLYEASQAAVRARDEFLSIASHELRTPLTPLVMQLHRLTSAARKGTLREMPEGVVQTIGASCDAQVLRLSRLIGALLDVSRIGSGQLALEREPLELAEVVRHVVERHAGEAATAQCAVDTHLDAGVFGRFDRLRMEQVVSNLFINALKFGRGRPISVSLLKVDAGAEIVVSDHGPGIAPGERARVFERFERIGSRDNVDGLGLGLFIAHAIVEAHGGSIHIETTEGGGATFRVCLSVS